MKKFVIALAILSSISLIITVIYDVNRSIKQTEQCDKICYPSVVLSYTDDCCICANNPNSVIWRKDIK